MKNKKLFAILTLVCFMFTLMPVAAFAATNDFYVVEKDNADKDSITAKVDEKIEVQVKGDEETEYIFWAEDADGDVEELTKKGASVEISFDAVGTYYVYAVKASLTEKLDIDNKTKANAVALIKDRCDYVDEALEVKVKKADAKYEITAVGDNYNKAEGTLTISAKNGWNEDGDLSIYLKKADGTAVKGEEIKFTTNSSYINVEVDDKATNRNGKIDITVTATKAGTYKVYANHADADKLTITVKVTTGTVNAVKTVAQPAANVALDTVFDGHYGYSGVAFELTAADGTILTNKNANMTTTDSTTGKTVRTNDYKIVIVDAPADSDIDGDDLYLIYDSYTNNAWTLKANDKSVSFDEEGKYVIKVTLENGSSATATVNVVEFDEPTRMILTYKANTVGYGETVEVEAVTYMDANGTTMSKSHPDYESYGKVEFAANGKAVDAVSSEGAITAKGLEKDGDELVGTTITAMAINEELELTGTATITVVDKAADLKYQSTTANIAVNNKLIVNPVDEDGNVVAAFNKNASTPSVYVLSAPANAAYSAEAEVTDNDELTVTFTASAVGEYKLQTVVRTGDSYLSSVDTITVGGTASDFKDVVVMSIGSANVVVNSDVKAIDAAPMIKDARTFVPFRALAEAFGATVAYDEATQSVTAELNGVKVVMTIGSTTYTVDGVAKTADVAPFINGSRTMVPVRFVAEAFGITVTPLYAADGSVADVLFAK